MSRPEYTIVTPTPTLPASPGELAAPAPEDVSFTTTVQLQLGSGDEETLIEEEVVGLAERERELLTVGVRVGPEGCLEGVDDGDIDG